MLAERFAERTEDLFPALSPVLVADRCDAEQAMGSARAHIAMLALELRVLRRDLVMAEAAADLRPDDVDLPESSRELLVSALEQRVSGRRSELAVDVDGARAEAARLVTAAQCEAAGVVAAAREEMLAVLLHGSDPRLLDPPDLRVVREAIPVSAPAEHQREAVAPLAPADQPPEATAWAKRPAEPPPSPAPSSVKVPSSPQPSPPATAQPPLSFWSLYLYADVLLPLVAVLIVVVVLLAWVG